MTRPKARKAWREGQGPAVLPTARPDAATLAERDRAYAAQIMGDPLPGRSAWDKKCTQTRRC